MNRAGCHHVPLARSPLGTIDYCSACNVVTLHIGVISLRFEPEAVESMWALLTEALAGLRLELAREKPRRRDSIAS